MVYKKIADYFKIYWDVILVGVATAAVLGFGFKDIHRSLVRDGDWFLILIDTLVVILLVYAAQLAYFSKSALAQKIKKLFVSRK